LIKEQILTSLGWNRSQILSFLHGVLPRRSEDLCFAHRFCPSLRPQIEELLTSRCVTKKDWMSIYFLDPVLPFSDIHTFVLDRILAILNSTMDILDTMCGFEMRADMINDHPWTQIAGSKAESLAVTLEDWTWLWHFSHDPDITRRSEETIEALCTTRDDWIEFLRIADEIEAFESRPLYNKALSMVGRDDEIEDIVVPEDEQDLPDDDPALVFLRTITSFLPDQGERDQGILFRELVTKIGILRNHRLPREEREAARMWIKGCDLPFGAFLSIARNMRFPTNPAERLLSYIFVGDAVYQPILDKLIAKATTVAECLSALQYNQGNNILERKLCNSASSLTDWVMIWRYAKYNFGLQEIALAGALALAAD